MNSFKDDMQLGFDPDALKAKYRLERDKRIREDGNAQYVAVADEHARYANDPYVTSSLQRKPIEDEVEIAIIGGGFGGLLMGARLREAGFDDIRVIEKGGDFGGTWYWNRYPGAMCDVESYCYLPLLEELGYIPKHKYSYGPEILQHSRNIAKYYNLYNNACLQTAVQSLRWDVDAWVISTDQDDCIRARFVAMANGPLNRPKLPGIPGIDQFKGHTFHTSRWDYEYTGGSPDGQLTGLKDKRVGVIGTGATAVQCIPHLGEWAEELYVFQRTPSSVDERNNRKTDPAWVDTLTAGWQQRRIENFTTLVTGGQVDEDLVGDGWTDIFRNLAEVAPPSLDRELTSEELAEITELSDYRKMNQIRARVESLVADPNTAEALKPWYRQFCKRPCFHDEYLQTFNRNSVHLIDTKGKGVERLTDNAVVVDGQVFDVDCLIFATGFEVGTSYARRAGYEVVGREGRVLSDYWSQGLRTLHGVQSNGFPNCFFLGSTQTAFTVNLPHTLDEQTKHVAHILHEVRARGKKTVEASADAESKYVGMVRQLAQGGASFYADCTPGYYNSEGAAGNPNGFFSELVPQGAQQFFDLLKEWRADGQLDGLNLN